MSFKSALRLLVFLAIFFVVLYVGLNNQQMIEFSFPGALKQAVRQPAAYIFFGFWAVGVVAGALFTGGGGGRGSSSKKQS